MKTKIEDLVAEVESAGVMRVYARNGARKAVGVTTIYLLIPAYVSPG